MIIFIFTGLTIVTIAGLLLPLLRLHTNPQTTSIDHTIAVYRDQLMEIEHDTKRGVMMQDEAEALRLEIQRRILASAIKPIISAPEDRRINLLMATVIACVVTVGAWQVYGYLGSPKLRDQPFAARANDPDMQLDALTQILSAALAIHPDAKGYKRLAGMEYALKRYDRATDNYQKAIDLHADDAETWGELGESIVMANDGAVVMDAQNSFKRALAKNPGESRARFYMGLAEAQIGDFKKAVGIWRDLEKNAAPDAPWLRMVQDNIRIYAKQGGFDPASISPLPAP